MAEAWPREADATVAVEAAARKTYEDGMAARAEVYPEGTQFTPWDDLGPVGKLEVRNAVLPIVWAALAALPDPRHEAWAEGFNCDYEGDGWPPNPYPSDL